ncbi:MAG: hypothetical protein EPO06_08630 [Burkholderiaceae bacterium]|nr:MAG: hypothetical protein EPO06_08630 [Burkholderiaceae bacterium]
MSKVVTAGELATQIGDAIGAAQTGGSTPAEKAAIGLTVGSLTTTLFEKISKNPFIEGLAKGASVKPPKSVPL